VEIHLHLYLYVGSCEVLSGCQFANLVGATASLVGVADGSVMLMLSHSSSILLKGLIKASRIAGTLSCTFSGAKLEPSNGTTTVPLNYLVKCGQRLPSYVVELIKF